MKPLIKAVIAVGAVAILSIGGWVAYQLMPVKAAETETIEIAKDKLTVGIISDSQIGQEVIFKDYEKKALEMLKNKDVDVLINVGDYTDTASKENWSDFKSVFDSVYSNDAEKPVQISIMGNHDYWLPNFVDSWEIPFFGKMQRRFMDNTGEDSPWTHKIINGYHFIGASPSFGSMGQKAYESKLSWIKEEIEAAIKDNPNNPIFVLTHNNPQDTVYMSDDDGCENLNELFSNYPQVVSISGHSHASLMDEESIYQKDYTALSTQCLSYVCFNENEIDLSQDGQNFIEENPMAMIMTLDSGNVSIQRYSVLDSKEQKDPWVLNFPANEETLKKYSDTTRNAAVAAPQWSDDFAYSCSRKGKNNVISFTAAKHNDYVKYYDMKFFDMNGKQVTFKTKDDKEKTSLRTISDYMLPADQRNSVVEIPISIEKFSEFLPSGKYTVELTAQSSFSPMSDTKTLEIEIK